MCRYGFRPDSRFSHMVTDSLRTNKQEIRTDETEMLGNIKSCTISAAHVPVISNEITIPMEAIVMLCDWSSPCMCVEWKQRNTKYGMITSPADFNCHSNISMLSPLCIILRKHEQMSTSFHVTRP